MKTAVFSIGLNVGAIEPADQLRRTLNLLTRVGRVDDLRIGAGEYAGIRERMLQARVTLPDYGNANAVARSAAETLGQECVAVLEHGAQRWRLVDAAGQVKAGGDLKEFPCLLTAPEDSRILETA